VLIYEYISGGGFADHPSLPAISSEAYAMLSALLKDFSYNANCETFTALDRRIAQSIEPTTTGKLARIASNDELETSLRSALSEVDAALVVAPETDGILSRMTGIVEEVGNVVLLGSSSNSVRRFSDKKNAIALAKSAGVSVPETISVSVDEGETEMYDTARKIGFPVIVKPQDGAGAEGVFLVSNRDDLDSTLKIARGEKLGKRLLMQEYVKGIDASVSALVSKNGVPLPLSMNRQLIELKPPSEASTYRGGYTPFHHPLEREAFDNSCKIIESVKGLRGYVGIDFVLTEEKPVFMEVNARITTSYAGLYRILRTDSRKGVANAITDAAMNDKLPSHVELNGYASYSKFKMKPDIKINKDMIDVLSNLEYVESPPLPENEGGMEAFLTGEGNSLDEALAAKSRNEKKFDMIARKFMEPLPKEH
jgi:hypothetical protein